MQARGDVCAGARDVCAGTRDVCAGTRSPHSPHLRRDSPTSAPGLVDAERRKPSASTGRPAGPPRAVLCDARCASHACCLRACVRGQKAGHKLLNDELVDLLRSSAAMLRCAAASQRCKQYKREATAGGREPMREPTGTTGTESGRRARVAVRPRTAPKYATRRETPRAGARDRAPIDLVAPWWVRPGALCLRRRCCSRRCTLQPPMARRWHT